MAGPALIVGSVLAIHHDFAFRNLLTSQHPDILAFWLPNYCFLGKTLAAGHIPGWNPFAMGGLPFAADPQSGWMHLPAMALFSFLSCDVAMRSMIVLQPALAGLGLYFFLTGERISRTAATVGGLMLALSLASSRIGLFLPFPSAFAWTAVLLWLCSACLKSRSWSGRLGWAALAAGAWGQLAAAYFAHGVILGTAAVVFYLAAKSWQAARDGSRPLKESLPLAGLLGASFVAVNLAFLLPRLAYASETSYGGVLAGQAQLGPAPGPAWPLKLAVSPGGYLGVLALTLCLAAFWSRRHRPLAFAFGGFGIASYLLGLDGLAHGLARAVEGVPVLDFFAHFPGRFSLGLLLSLPILAAIGVEAWMEPRSWGERAVMAVPGVLTFLLLPIALGAGWARLAIPFVGVAAGGVVLAAVARRPQVAALVPVVLVCELTVSGLMGQMGGALGADRAYADDLFDTASTAWLVPLASPDVDVGAYLKATPIVRALRDPLGGRYMSLDPAEASARGYLTLQSPAYWGLMANQRAMLFELEDAQGYNPVQLARYWRFVRATSGGTIAYNASFYRRRPDTSTLNLLQVNTVVGPEGQVPGSWHAVAREGRWVVYRSPDPSSLSSVLTRWQVVGGPEASLRAVTAPDFDPSRTVVLETDPDPWFGGIANTGGELGGPHRPERPQTERIQVEAPSPAVVLVRIPYARNWRATVDGRPARILPADHFLMGVPVQAGSHTIGLRYHDPWIGYGLLGSLLAVVALLVSALLARGGGAARGPAREGQEAVSEARSG